MNPYFMLLVYLEGLPAALWQLSHRTIVRNLRCGSCLWWLSVMAN